MGFSRNRSAYYRWCITRHARATYRQAVVHLTGMDNQDTGTHKDLRPSQIADSEKETCSAVAAILNFINPFNVEDKDTLFCLSSGSPATDDVASDLLGTDEVGEKACRTFVEERLIMKITDFNAPIKRLGLKTFSSIAKTSTVKGQSKKTKQITAERNVFGQLVLLAVHNNVSLEKVLCFPLGPVP